MNCKDCQAPLSENDYGGQCWPCRGKASQAAYDRGLANYIEKNGGIEAIKRRKLIEKLLMPFDFAAILLTMASFAVILFTLAAAVIRELERDYLVMCGPEGTPFLIGSIIALAWCFGWRKRLSRRRDPYEDQIEK